MINIPGCNEGISSVAFEVPIDSNLENSNSLMADVFQNFLQKLLSKYIKKQNYG